AWAGGGAMTATPRPGSARGALESAPRADSGRGVAVRIITPGMTLDSLAIVGVGLIGGSAGLAARERGVARRVVGVGRSAESLAAARRAGCIDDGTPDLAAAVRDANLVLVCTPVDRVAEHVRAA